MPYNRIQGTLRLALITAPILLLGFFSCKKSSDSNSATSQFNGTWSGSGCVTQTAKWTEMAPNLATGRKGAVSFAINDLVYVGGGTNKTDFWAFNPSANTWTHLADIPYTPLVPPVGGDHYRGYGVGFSIGDKGYVGLGAGRSLTFPLGTLDTLVNDLYEYDPTTNLWVQKASLPAPSRQGAFSFVINSVAYVGGGYDSTGTWLKDMWAYDPTADNWTRKADLPVYIINPFAFSSGDSGYVSCGKQGYYEDTATFMYKPLTNTWVRRAGFPGHTRQAGTAFVLNKIAYCGLGKGLGVSNEFEDLYTYDIATNTWKILGNFPAGPDAFATAAVTGGKAYIGTGTDIYGNFYNYWYQYIPLQDSESYTITKGPNNFSLYMSYKIGNSDTCARDVQLLGTLSSNASDNFSMANQSFTDRCGKTYTISGSGTIIDDIIVITTVRTTPEGTTACTFRGRK